MCLCVFSLFQVTVMQTVWFSTSCSSRRSLASSASFLWTGTPTGGSDSDWRPTDVLTVSLFSFVGLTGLSRVVILLKKPLTLVADWFYLYDLLSLFTVPKGNVVSMTYHYNGVFGERINISLANT